MITRRHFILTLPYDDLQHSLNICVGGSETQRYTLDGTSKVYLKTEQSLIDEYLINNPEITEDMLFPDGQCVECADLAHARTVLSTAEWVDLSEIIIN